MKRVVSIAAVLVAMTVQAQQPAAPKVAAVVNGETITVDDLARLYGRLPAQMRQNYDANGGKAQFLEQYINKRLLVQEAMKQNFLKDEYVAKVLGDAREAAIFDLYVKEVVADGVISEADLRSYYEQNKNALTKPEQIKVRHIIATPVQQQVSNTTGDNAKNEIDAKKKITDLFERGNITAQTFAQFAMRFSEDGSAPKGGDLGWFERGKMVPEFDEVAFSLNPGEISAPVKTQFGWHLLFLEARKPAVTPSFEDVRRQIRDTIVTERAEKVLGEVNKLTGELRRHSQVQVNTGNLE